MEYLLKGLFVGFIIALPVGPIGLLCLRKIILNGKMSGFISGMGSATADVIYAAVSVFSLTFISHFLTSNQLILKIIGGIFLCYLGIKIYITKNNSIRVNSNKSNLIKDYIFTFFLTLTNPATIIFFTGIFAGIGITELSYVPSVLLVGGLFLGSIIWWSLICAVSSRISNELLLNKVDTINKVSGILLLLLGLLQIVPFFV